MNNEHLKTSDLIPGNKYRLRIEKTPEFQLAYINPGFGERHRAKLIETVKREVWTFTGEVENHCTPIFEDSSGKHFAWHVTSLLEKV